jgi:hypothetical protein
MPRQPTKPTRFIMLPAFENFIGVTSFQHEADEEHGAKEIIILHKLHVLHGENPS